LPLPTDFRQRARIVREIDPAGSLFGPECNPAATSLPRHSTSRIIRFAGAPGWLELRKILYRRQNARSGGSAGQLKLMIQNLFGRPLSSVVHHETRELPFLCAFREGRTEPKLTVGTDGPRGFQIDKGAVVFHKLAMSVLADRLPRFFKELGASPGIGTKPASDGSFRLLQ